MTRRWVAPAFAIVTAALVVACGSWMAPSLDRVADGYARAALMLAQHDAELVESWRGPSSFTPGPRVPVAAIATDIAALQKTIDRLASNVSNAKEKARIDYLDAQLRGLHFAAERLLGRSTTIDEQARDEFAVTFSRIDQDSIQGTLAQIDRLLPGAGPLSDRVAAFRLRTTIPRDRQPAAIKLAVQACRDAIAPVIDLPSDERVSILFRNNMGWDAYAHYEGDHQTTIDISDAGPLDISRALRLACHEGYAGHHVQHLLIDRALQSGHRPELQLSPGFGRHLLYAEGAAEVGADLAFTDAQRTALYRDRLFPAAGLNVDEVSTLVAIDSLLPALLPVVTDTARRYLEGEIAQAAAIERLRSVALLTSPETTLAFIERRRARALVYGEGRRVMYSMMPSKDLNGLRALLASTALE